MSIHLNLKTSHQVTQYQQLLLIEKTALLACPAAKEAMIDLLLQLQQISVTRRINAKQFARWVTGINRDLLTPDQLVAELSEVPLSLEHWNTVRRSAEHEQGAIYDKWRASLDDVSQIRNEVLLDYMYLAKNMAYSFSPCDPLVREDYEGYAVIGLIWALDSFKPDLQISFGTHAYNWMLCYLSRMSERRPTVTPTKNAHRILAKYRAFKSNFVAQHSRAPKLQEAVEQLDVPVEKLLPIIAMAGPIASLDDFIANTTFKSARSSEYDRSTTLYDVLPGTSGVTPGNDLEDVKKAIIKALTCLTEKDRLAVTFYLEMNLYGVSSETSYPIADGPKITKEWARARLRRLLPSEVFLCQ